ncbi:MAG: family 78 glycoside hydrolase catalytic domain [Oscillospiraceae bacterium]|nr:family 78 glycoside hydrolase catalytic domain [Oscillospiraceae bacterium]
MNTPDISCFITIPESEQKKFGNPWTNIEKNSKSKKLLPENGINLFKKTICISAIPESAFISATAFGIFDLFVNGRRVGTVEKNGSETFDELKPGWTDYRKRLFYYSYNLVPYLCIGENTVCACVSNGWWNGRISFGFYGNKQCAFYADGEIVSCGEKYSLSTSSGWLAAIAGPVLTADIWDGEYYDARIAPGGMASNIDWTPAKLIEPYTGALNNSDEYPRITARPALSKKPLSAICYSGTKDNGTDFGEINTVCARTGSGCETVSLFPFQTLLIDFGQNIVGRPRIKLHARRGTEVIFYFGELLNDTGMRSRGNDGPKGSIYVENYRSALAKAVYIASGNDNGEEYFPTHTFFGFRYIEIECSDDIYIETLIGEVLGSDTREVSSLVTSNGEINRLYSNILWGQRGNYLSIPTDCPQRDERLGWTGDTQMFCGAAAYNANVLSFLRKWLRDMRDSQSEEGGYCDVNPRVFTNSGNEANAAWGDAGIIIPYKMYIFYGDETVISECFASMEKYMSLLASLEPKGPRTAYGDWLCFEKTDKRYIADCMYAYDTLLMSKMCSVLSEKADNCEARDFYALRKEHYSSLFSTLRSEFYNKYFSGGELSVKTQTSYLLAIKCGLLDNSENGKAVKMLKKKIAENKYVLSTGFVGTGILNMTLSENGLDDEAYSLLMQTECPSWLYSVRQGATTVWERWNSYTLKSGFGDVSMNSFNHYAYGAVGEWMFAFMAGISPCEDEPGFKKLVYCPRPDLRPAEKIPEGQMRMSFVQASFNSPHGKINAEWSIENNAVCYRLSTPVPVRFDLVGVTDESKVTINSIPLPDTDFIPISGLANKNGLIFEAPAGEYNVISRQG